MPSGSEGYRKAEVTAGGVDTRELISQTMESRRVPGLYFIGEVVDVTGWLGGYNFQWAWASAHACAMACAELARPRLRLGGLRRPQAPAAPARSRAAQARCPAARESPDPCGLPGHGRPAIIASLLANAHRASAGAPSGPPGSSGDRRARRRAEPLGACAAPPQAVILSGFARKPLLHMTTIRVKENEPFDVALRRFKRTIEKLGLLTELRAREFYEKPTAERKRKKAAAVKRHFKRVRSMQLPKKLY